MSGNIDNWGDEIARSSSGIVSNSGAALGARKVAKPDVVRDDWEDDEEEEVGKSEEDNKAIWEAANAKESSPMPAVVLSRGTSINSSASSLPLNQPPAMRILKRPSPSTSPSPSTPSTGNPTSETLQQREARYQAARERIFGPSNGDDGSTPTASDKKSTPISTPPLAPANKVVREPRGPNSSSNLKGSRGFGDRTTRAPPTTTTYVSTPSPTHS